MPSSRRILASLSSTTRILAFRISDALTMPFVLISFGLAGRLSREFERNVQRFHELIDLDRFGEIPEKSCQHTLLNVAWHRIGAEGNDGDVRRRRIFAKDFQSFDTADAGQIDVHQDHLRMVGARKLNTE